jgi:RNA polymerase sigma factor (sigma-70 family)
MLHLSEQRVIYGFNRKEPAAITWIYETYHRDVLSIVRKSTDGSPDAEDLVADIFYKLIKHPGRFERLKKIEYFLYKTAKNTCLDYLKHQLVKKLKSDEVEKYYQDINERELETADIREKFDQLMQIASAELSSPCKQIIQLSYAQGLGNREIAEKLGLSEKTIANLKTLAMKTLKLVMERPGKNGFLMFYFL